MQDDQAGLQLGAYGKLQIAKNVSTVKLSLANVVRLREMASAKAPLGIHQNSFDEIINTATIYDTSSESST